MPAHLLRRECARSSHTVAVGVASGDMKGNANTLKSIAAAAGRTTLESLVLAECGGKSEKQLKKVASDGKTASCALLWLARALNFILKMLTVMIVERGKKLSECVMAGYEVSLRPHHGMMIRSTFSMAVKAAPDRAEFIAKLGPSEDEVFARLSAALPNLTALVQGIQELLVGQEPKLFAP